MAIHLEEETQRVLERLRTQADARNMGLADYLQLLAETGVATAPPADLDLREFERLLEQISDGLPVLPALPADFSRADVYAEHN
jgi:hypothetical protein